MNEIKYLYKNSKGFSVSNITEEHAEKGETFGVEVKDSSLLIRIFKGQITPQENKSIKFYRFGVYNNIWDNKSIYENEKTLDTIGELKEEIRKYLRKNGWKKENKSKKEIEENLITGEEDIFEEDIFGENKRNEVYEKLKSEMINVEDAMNILKQFYKLKIEPSNKTQTDLNIEEYEFDIKLKYEKKGGNEYILQIGDEIYQGGIEIQEFLDIIESNSKRKKKLTIEYIMGYLQEKKHKVKNLKYLNKRPNTFWENLLGNKSEKTHNNGNGIEIFYDNVPVKISDLKKYIFNVEKEIANETLTVYKVIKDELRYKRVFGEKIYIKNKGGFILFELVPITFKPKFESIFKSIDFYCLQGFKIKNNIKKEEYSVYRKITNPFHEADFDLLRYNGIQEQLDFREETIRNIITENYPNYLEDVE